MDLASCEVPGAEGELDDDQDPVGDKEGAPLSTRYVARCADLRAAPRGTRADVPALDQRADAPIESEQRGAARSLPPLVAVPALLGRWPLSGRMGAVEAVSARVALRASDRVRYERSKRARGTNRFGRKQHSRVPQTALDRPQFRGSGRLARRALTAAGERQLSDVLSTR